MNPATIVVPNETTVVSLWVKPWVQLAPLLLLIKALTLGRSDLTKLGYSNPGKRTGPGNAAGIMRTMYFSGPVSVSAGSDFFC